MKELVKVIAMSLVDHPEEVVVNESEKEDTLVLELKEATFLPWTSIGCIFTATL